MNTQEILIEKSKNRFEFLQKLYELSGGIRTELIDGSKVASEIGLAHDLSKAIAARDYLLGKGLLEDANIVSGPLGVNRITHSGVQAVEEAMTSPNEQSEHFMPINRFTTINNTINVSQMVGSSIQQGTIRSDQKFKSAIINSSDITGFLREVRGEVNNLNLEPEKAEELVAEINTSVTQLESPRPKNAILRECLSSIKNILESTAGSAIGGSLAAKIPALLASL